MSGVVFIHLDSEHRTRGIEETGAKRQSEFCEHLYKAVFTQQENRVSFIHQ